MSERFIPPPAGLEIKPQTVYAGTKEQKLMADGAQISPESGGGWFGFIRKIFKKKEAEPKKPPPEKPKNGEKRVVRGSAREEQKPQQAQQEQVRKTPIDVSRMPVDVLREFRSDSKDAAYFEDVDTGVLQRYHARLKQHEEQTGTTAPIVHQMERTLRERGAYVESYASTTTLHQEPRELGRGQQKGFIVGQDPFENLVPTGNPRLDHIVDELNAIPVDDPDNPNNPNIRRNRATPNFIEDQRQRIQRIVDQDPTLAPQARRLLDQLDAWRIPAEDLYERRMRHAEETRRGLYLERKLTTEDKEKINDDIDAVVNAGQGAPVEGEFIDFIFNRMFDQSDKRAREEFRGAFTGRGEFERNEFGSALTEINEQVGRQREEALNTGDMAIAELARRKRQVIEKFFEKYDNEYNIREKLHNAFFIAETEGEFQQFTDYNKQFASHYADLAFMDAPEVEAALRIRERVLYEIREEHGFIRPELVTYNPDPDKQGSFWEQRTRQLLEELNTKGVFMTARRRAKEQAKVAAAQKEARERQAISRRIERDSIEDWQIDRAMSLSRGLGMVLLRFPEIVAEQPLNAPSDTNQAWLSPPWEKIVWELNMLDYKAKKYNFGREARAILYAMASRNKKGGIFDFWNQDELKQAISQDAITVLGNIHGNDKRMIDMRNIFRTGGPFSHTGWRPYIAALESDRSGLRKLLSQNPGIAMKSLYNRYEILGKSIDKYALFKDENLTPDEKLARWEEIEATGKKARGGETSWGQAVTNARSEFNQQEIDSWIATAGRVPHVVWRIITDEANGLLTRQEKQALTAQIAQAIGVGLTQDGKLPSNVLAELGNDITLAKEKLMKRRNDTVRHRGEDAWTPALDRLGGDPANDDFTLIDSAERQNRARAFRDAVVDILNSNRYDLRTKIPGMVYDRGFPFAVTSEDVPWSEFAFGQTGTRGYFTRKINDAFSVSRANAELEKYLKNFTIMQTPEQYVEQLKKIYEAAEEYDQHQARAAIVLIAKGTIRFLEKDGLLKIPIFGEIMSLSNKVRHRGDSFAETFFGSKMPAWDADDIYNFTEQLRQILTLEEIQEIRKETGGTFLKAFGKKTKLAAYLFFLFFGYEMIQRIVKER